MYDPSKSVLWDYKEHNVPMRDTFIVNGHSWKVIAFVTNNPGAWYVLENALNTHFAV